jgi:hypothetical protein
MARDEVKLPQDIASMSEDDRKKVARDLIKTTRLTNAKIASATGLGVRQVATMRLHSQGKVPPPPPRTPAEPIVKAEGGAAAQEEEAPAEPSVELRDIDDKTPPAPRSPSQPEKRAVNEESTYKDVLSEVRGLGAKLSVLSAKIENGGVGTAPGAPQQQVEEKITSATFDVVTVKVPVDTYRLALFSAWKAEYNSNAAQSGGQPYTKDADGFLLDTFDEFMEQRGIDFTYTQTRVVRAPAVMRSR